MSLTPADAPLSFDDLRRALIGSAQAASSARWSDYNLHDPGVTMLEQTAFAISELAFRAGVPIRDLLTGDDGEIDLAGVGLAAPDTVLAAAPVSLASIQAQLSELPQIANAVLECDGVGRVTVRIVPQDGVDPEEAAEAVRRAYCGLRPLCTALVDIRICEPRPVRLQAHVVVSARAVPEEVVAEIWLRADQVLRRSHLATPQLAGQGGQAPLGRAPQTGRPVLFAALRALPGLQDLLDVRISGLDGGGLGDVRIDEDDSYPALVRASWQEDFTVEQNGGLIALDPSRADRAFAQRRANVLASLSFAPEEGDGPMAAAQLAVRPKGRRRRFEYVSVNATLPMAYFQPPNAPAALQFAGYRALIDTILGAMTADLANLPALLSVDPDTALRPHDHLPALADQAGILRDAGAWAEIFRHHGPRPDHLLRLFDFLLAIQGEAMPDDDRADLDRDLLHAQRPAAPLQRRARLLKALPGLNGRRATGPDGAEPGGVLGRLLCLVDMVPAEPAEVAGVLPGIGLRLVDNARAGAMDRSVFADIPQDTDLIVPERDVPALAPDEIAALPCAAGGALGTALFHAAALSESWLVSPGDAAWQLLVEIRETGQIFDAGRCADRDEAILRANGLRAAFAAANRACEGAWLIENIHLGDAALGRGAFGATLVLPGWSLRCASPSFRRYVETCLERVSPAHCKVRVVWLQPEAFSDFAAFHAQMPDNPEARAALAALIGQGAVS